MKNLKKWLTSPKATVVLFVLSAALLLFTTIGAVLAALRYRSATYGARIEQCCIGVSLIEQCANDKTVQVVASRDHAHRDDKKNPGDKWNGNEEGVLLGSVAGNKEENARFLGADTAVFPGKAYPEAISVRNSGEFDEYVRLTIYRYWLNPAGEKAADAGKGTSKGLSPKLINLNWINDDVWLLDKSASTDERVVYYYKNVLKSGKDTKPICDTLIIDDEVAQWVSQTQTPNEKGGKKIVTTYDYEGWQFCVEAQVDAVQNHNIVDAAKSAWGVDLTVDDKGQISLKN